MQINLPEIVFASADKAESQRISRWVRSGVLRKLVPRVYTSNSKDSDEAIVTRNLYLILSRLFPVAVLSHRTALEGGPTETGDIFLTYKYSRKVILPGFSVHLLKGPGPAEGDMPFLQGLFMSSRARAFLENLQISRSRSSMAKVLSRADIEERLDRICQIQGADALNELRDEARPTALSLHMDEQFRKLNNIISAILRTRPARELSSPQARATSLGVPYDPQRLETFNSLFACLTQSQLPMRKETGLSEEEIHLAAFFEAYFSNHIEGTEFEVDQAHAIVFQNKIPQGRPEDAHDIMGTFRIVANQQEMHRVPESFDDFISLITSRHHAVMEARPDKLPGGFKQEPNRAGETHFVAPTLVQGTLLQGFDMYHAVEPGLARAIFMMFMVAEVHPFVDGNGRIARIMMNAELIHADLCRIIVPIVFRDDYLLALRALSRSNNPEPLIKVMDFAQLFTHELQFPSYNTVTKTLTVCNAFKEPDEARLKLPSSLGKGG